MPSLAVLALLAVPVLAGPSPDGDGGGEGPVNTMCPVLTDERVDPSITVQWEGRTVAFCCKMCKRDFQADPAAYAANLPPADPAPGEADQADGGGAEEGGGADAGPLGAAERLGRLHPLVVHFPIALLVAAGLGELLGRRPLFRQGARFALLVGAPAAVVAAALGWMAGEASSYPSLEDVLFRHRWLGVATAVLAVAAFAADLRSARSGGRRGLLRLLLLGAVVCAALAGHEGGTLVFGRGYFLEALG